ncbi:MAG TPA: SulP family inorganic anion transporter [Tepidisphaeraceae bacterium]|nr:SulP family inorganic anion transporter [Tepidisphaeraceae bacterium]
MDDFNEHPRVPPAGILDAQSGGSGAAARLSQLAVPFRPPFETAKHYSIAKFRKDIVAGLTVSVVELPQAMAYALLAGVPPQYGIYTSVIQGILGALFSSSHHMASGPTNTQSLLIASALTRITDPTSDPATYLRLVFVLALLKGLIQLAFAVARMGAMVRYVSRSVIVGLAGGAGVLIIVGQIPRVLGLAVSGVPQRFAGAAGEIEKLLPQLHHLNTKALTVGAVSLAVMLGVRGVSKLLPGALMGVIAGAAVVVATGWGPADLPLVGQLPRALPGFVVPHFTWGEAEALLAGALALALLGMLETVAIAKGIAASSGDRIDPNREFFAQGLANAVSSVFQCIPGSGSFTRSALDHAAGAATRFAAVFNALFVGILFVLAGGVAKYIPLATLGAVLIVIGFGLIDWRYIPRMFRASRSDAVVCGITFAGAMVLPLELAIFLGIFLNLALYLRTSSRLHVTEMIHRTGVFHERPIVNKHTGERQVVFLQLEGDLFFGVADELQDRLNALVGSTVRVVILRLKRTHSIDATVLGVLERFVADMKSRQRYVVLCGVKPELMSVLRTYGLIEQIGRDNVFPTGGGIFTSAKLALERAQTLVGRSIDTDGIDIDDSIEPNYVI